MKETLITKADGTHEPFRPEKLERSLKNAGASLHEAEAIVGAIERELTDGMTTEEIYRRAFERLRAEPEPVAARYSLRRALFNLGPTGFPFEDYLAKLFEAEGYTTTVRALLKGRCVSHEVDVLATRAGETVAVEAKFHSVPGIKSDLQVLLSAHARFRDLADAAGEMRIDRGMVITNTKFTTVALEYAACAGVDVVSWNAPKGRSLQEWIERTKRYPITVLSSLSGREKTALLAQGTVLCSDVVDNRDVLASAGIAKESIEPALSESVKLCAVGA